MKGYNKESRKRSYVNFLLKSLDKMIEETRHFSPHPGLVIATHHFHQPYPKIKEIPLLSLATMDLLIQFAYPSIVGYAKFTITFKIIRPFNEEIPFTIGPAIPLTYEDGRLMPKRDIFSQIYQRIKEYKEIYGNDVINSLSIRVYMEEKKNHWRPLWKLSFRWAFECSLDSNSGSGRAFSSPSPLGWSYCIGSLLLSLII